METNHKDQRWSMRKNRPPMPNPARQEVVETALRPFLPALAVAHPDNHRSLTVGAHYSYWISLFRRPMLSGHEGPAYPPEVATKISAVLSALDPSTRSPT